MHALIIIIELPTLDWHVSSIGGMDRPILFIYANRFKGIETGF